MANSGPRNAEEMSLLMSEFHRQSLMQQQHHPVDHGSTAAQSSAGYGLFSLQGSIQAPSELFASQRMWPQSDFVSSVIEAPIEHTNPGWRDHDILSASSLRERAEKGMQNLIDTPSNAASHSASVKSRPMYQASTSANPHSNPGSGLGSGFGLGTFGASTNGNGGNGPLRDPRKTIPSHLTHMKYKGYDPSDANHTASHEPQMPFDENVNLNGTASFGSKARRRTDAVSQVEEEQKRKDLEHQLLNFPPIFPSGHWGAVSDEEAEIRKSVVEDEMRAQWNIPARTSSPSLTRRSTSQRHGGLNRRSSMSLGHDERTVTTAFTSATSLPQGQSSRLDPDRQSFPQPSSVTGDGTRAYTSVKVAHPLLTTNSKTWDKILEHMQNHGTIVNPFNHSSRFRLRACFPPGTPLDILNSSDSRQTEYPADPEMLRAANDISMGPNWIKMTYETRSQATAALHSDGIVFDGFQISVELWDGDDIASRDANVGSEGSLRNGALPSNIGATRSQQAHNSHQDPSSSKDRDKLLVIVHDDGIFLKHPGLLDRIRESLYGYFFQSTARYDVDGNYIKGSGGLFLELWHMLTG